MIIKNHNKCILAGAGCVNISFTWSSLRPPDKQTWSETDPSNRSQEGPGSGGGEVSGSEWDSARVCERDEGGGDGGEGASPAA